MHGILGIDLEWSVTAVGTLSSREVDVWYGLVEGFVSIGYLKYRTATWSSEVYLR